jgi:hypothetical protein
MDISFVVISDSRGLLYSGKNLRDPKEYSSKMDEALAKMNPEEGGYLFVREQDNLSLQRIGQSLDSFHIYDEKTIQALKGLIG